MRRFVKLKNPVLFSAFLILIIVPTAAEENKTLKEFIEGPWDLYSRKTPESPAYLNAFYTFTQKTETRFIGRGTAAYNGTESEVEFVLDVEKKGSGYHITAVEKTNPGSQNERVWSVYSGDWNPAEEPLFFELTGYPEKYPGDDRFRRNIEMLKKAESEPWELFAGADQAELYTNPDQTVAYLKIEPELWDYLLQPGNQYQINPMLTEILSGIIAFEYDFFVFVLDLDSRPGHMAYGIHRTFQRDAKGIGDFRDARLPDWFPEKGRLKGSIMLSYRTGISHGPLLHELVHQWGSGFDELFKPENNRSHWGAASGYGQLGGFDLDSLRQISPNTFRADYFSFTANGGNGVKYSDLELYIMGLIGPDKVPDIWIGSGEKSIKRQRGENGFTEFSVESYRMISIDDIIEKYGPRVPSAAESQKVFKMLPVLAGTEPRADSAQFLGDAYDFTYPGDNHRELYNFYEATSGKASMVLYPVKAVQ